MPELGVAGSQPKAMGHFACPLWVEGFVKLAEKMVHEVLHVEQGKCAELQVGCWA